MVFSLLGGTFDFQARFSSHFFIGVHVPLVQWAYSYPSLERLCGTLFLSVVSICQDTLLGRPVSFSKVFACTRVPCHIITHPWERPGILRIIHLFFGLLVPPCVFDFLCVWLS